MTKSKSRKPSSRLSKLRPEPQVHVVERVFAISIMPKPCATVGFDQEQEQEFFDAVEEWGKEVSWDLTEVGGGMGDQLGHYWLRVGGCFTVEDEDLIGEMFLRIYDRYRNQYSGLDHADDKCHCGYCRKTVRRDQALPPNSPGTAWACPHCHHLLPFETP